MREHPDAFWLLEVPYSAVWQPPEEPHSDGWHWQPKMLRAHRKRVRRSLEGFLNTNLAQLDGMVRTGWFIIQRVRTAVTELQEVPHRPGERQPRSIRKMAERFVHKNRSLIEKLAKR